jgi:hypothetical protein
MIEEIKDLLYELPDDWRVLAVKRFDPDFYESHKDLEYPIESSGDALRCMFDWEQTEEGYEIWQHIHDEYGNVGPIDN